MAHKVDLSLAELHEMINRQQMQINTNEQIIAAKEQRLRLLRQHVTRRGCAQNDDSKRKLINLKRAIDERKTGVRCCATDVEIIQQFCFDKERELEGNYEDDEDDVVVGSGEKVSSLPRSLAKAEIDRLKQELLIRNRINEQQARRIVSQREFLNQRQRELVDVDRELVMLTERGVSCSSSWIEHPTPIRKVRRRDSFLDATAAPEEEVSDSLLVVHEEETIVEASPPTTFSKKKVTFNPMDILLDAAAEGDLELVIEMAMKVGDAGKANDEGITAIHNAVCTGNLDVARFLIKFGSDVNYADNDGWTPLHCAASCNNLEMARLLLENGACVFAQTHAENEMPVDKCDKDEPGFEECRQYLQNIMDNMGRGDMQSRFVYVIYNFDPTNEDELEVTAGQRVMVIDRNDQDEDDKDSLSCGEKEQPRMWWLVEDDEKQMGLVPCNYLALFPKATRKDN